MNKKLLTFIIGLGLVLSCSKTMTGGSTETTSNVSGVIYDADGARAAHATVRFYPVNYDPQTGSLGKTKTVAAVTGIDSTTTDGSGNYSAMLDSGSYNLLASGDTTLAYHDSIHAMKGDTARPIDTLRSPGALRGVIQMQGSDDPRTVFIIFIGTGSVYVPQDSLGNFLIQKLAQGSYHVRFLTTLDNYKVKDTTLGVTAGKIDTLAAPIQLQYTGIPVPAGLHIQYDSAKEIVTLIWNTPTTGTKVASYNVYREESDSTTFALIKGGVPDTTYQDSTGIQDKTYEYKVAAVDTNQTPGVMSRAVGVMIVSAYKLLQTINLDSLNNEQISFAMAKDTTFYIAFNMGGGSSFIGVFDKTGHNTAIIGRGKFIQLYDVAVDSRKYIYAAVAEGNKIFKFNSNGDSIGEWSVSEPLRILIDNQDDLFILNGSFPFNNHITKFDTMGNILATDSIPFINEGAEIVLGPGGDIFVQDGTTNQLIIYDNNLVLKGNSTFTLNNNLRAIDSSGNIYLENESSYTITAYNSIGVQIAAWNPEVVFYQMHNYGPNLYILGWNANHVIKIFSIP